MNEVLVKEEQVDLIHYIKEHMVDWLEEKNIIPFPQKQDGVIAEILKRLDRIEIQISHQNEKFELILGQMDRRFEQVDRRFEQVDRRFEQVDKRFEQVDKRFEEMQHSMDKRFEQVDKRFTQMFWFGSIGFIALGTLVSIYQFLG